MVSMCDRPFACPLSENDIQRAVISHIKTRGTANVFAFHVPNGGYRRKAEARVLKGIGVVAGVPDIIIVKQGNCFALELKRDKGRLSDSQEKALDGLRAAGAVVAVAYGLDAAIEQLEKWNVVKGQAR